MKTKKEKRCKKIMGKQAFEDKEKNYGHFKRNSNDFR